MEFIITGGVWFTVPILVMGIASLALILYSSIRILNGKKVGRQLADTILFLGFLSLSFGIFGMITGMFQAAGAIQRAREISPSLIWAGFRISLITVIMGFVILFYSLIGWFVIRPYRLDKTS
jgi:hypothetical protein